MTGMVKTIEFINGRCRVHVFTSSPTCADSIIFAKPEDLGALGRAYCFFVCTRRLARYVLV